MISEVLTVTCGGSKGSARDTCPLPTQSNFSSFMQLSGKNGQDNIFVPPPLELAPLLREILDLLLVTQYYPWILNMVRCSVQFGRAPFSTKEITLHQNF